MTIEEMKEKLEKELPPKRFVHSVNVMDTAVKLAGVYNEDVEKAAVAGLLHDCARGLGDEQTIEMCRKYGMEPDSISVAQPVLLHGPLGAILAKEEYGIGDEEILSAVRCHTTGCENMSTLDKIIFLADYIEPGRSFEGVERVRRTAFDDLDQALITAFDGVLEHVIKKGKLIHPDTVKARNYLLQNTAK